MNPSERIVEMKRGHLLRMSDEKVTVIEVAQPSPGKRKKRKRKRKRRKKEVRDTDALVYIKDNVVSLRDPTGRFYDVELVRAKTIPRLFDWVNHLLTKPWITTEHLREFIEFVSYHNDLDIYEFLL